MFGWHRQISRGERRSVWAAWQWRRPALRTAARSHSRHSPDRLRGIAVVDQHCSAQERASVAASGIIGIRLNLIGKPDPAFATRLFGFQP